MRIIDNWRDAPRMYSIWAFGAIGTIQGSLLAFVSEEQLAARVLFAPTWTYGEIAQAVVAALALSGTVGRLIAQQPTPPKS